MKALSFKERAFMAFCFGGRKMKLLAIMWDSHARNTIKASKALEKIVTVKVYSSKRLEQEAEIIEEVLEEAKHSDVILLYRSTESIWEIIEKKLKELGKRPPIVCCGHDPSYWTLSTVELGIVANVYYYITYGGEENFINMLKYIACEVVGMDIKTSPPKALPWEGLYHPKAPKIFDNTEDYLKWYVTFRRPLNPLSAVGILFSRFYWVNDNIAVEKTLIDKLESLGLSVIPVFSYSLKDEGLGTKGSGEVLEECFIDKEGNPRIDALINLQVFLLGSNVRGVVDGKIEPQRGVDILRKLKVPVFSPICSFYQTVDKWLNDPQGADSLIIGWSIAMPEFEGRIEPVIVGGLSSVEEETGLRVPIVERIEKLARRVLGWVKLRKKPVSDRKVAFILHNNPCASVEATVGAGAHLDTLETVARILTRMEKEGYRVNPPRDGKELIETIMDRKAISEFRWTTVEEIVNKGGAIALIDKEKYLEWFNELPEKTRNKMIEAWGNPPGEPKEGVPTAMVYQDKIVVTGIQYGNAVVCVQPKRGCAGSRCDGRVCKILHDPDIPPPHQYIATYRWLSREFGADIIVHVGTHGNLEFLPGKGNCLSAGCFPDIAIDRVPHLYIYNADNPAEGTIAKRRSYATLVDHMQTVMTQSGLYEELEELERLLGEYEKVKGLDRGRAHATEHLILELLQKTNLDKEIRVYLSKKETKKVSLSELNHEEIHQLPFDEIAREAHNILSRIRNTQIQDGMHIFGKLPEGEKRIDFIYSILRFDGGEGVSFRREVAKMLGLDLGELLLDQGKLHPTYGKSYGALLEEIDRISKDIIRQVLLEVGAYQKGGQNV